MLQQAEGAVQRAVASHRRGRAGPPAASQPSGWHL